MPLYLKLMLIFTQKTPGKMKILVSLSESAIKKARKSEKEYHAGKNHEGYKDADSLRLAAYHLDKAKQYFDLLKK
jgi:hypothetical protein